MFKLHLKSHRKRPFHPPYTTLNRIPRSLKQVIRQEKSQILPDIKEPFFKVYLDGIRRMHISSFLTKFRNIDPFARAKTSRLMIRKVNNRIKTLLKRLWI